MPFPPNRILNGLRTAPLLGRNDLLRPSLATGPDPNQPEDVTSGWEAQDPSISLDAFNDRMSGEIKDRIFQNARLGNTTETSALQGLLGNYQQDIQDSPLTQQRSELETQRKADLAAQSQGFTAQGRGLATASPSQVQGEYGRRQAEFALERPYREAMARQQTAVDQARTQGEYALKRQQLIEDTKNQQFRQFQDWLAANSGTAGEGNAPIRGAHIGPSGPSVSFGPQNKQGAEAIDQGLLNKLTDATNAWANARSSSQKAAAMQALQQARAAVISKFAGDEGNKYFVQEMMSSPDTMDLPVEQWIQMFRDKYGSDMDAGDFTPEDIDQINYLTGIIRRTPQQR